MKLTKKLLSMLLTLAMLAVMAVPAFAVGGTGTITIKNPNADATYTAYKILDLESYDDTTPDDDAAGLYSYKVATGWSDFVKSEDIKDKYLKVNEAGGVTWVENADPAVFAKLAETFAKANNIPAIDIPHSNNSATVTGLDLGYYLVTSTLNNGVLCSLGTTDTTAEITEKNEVPFIEKTIENKDIYAAIGSTVNYTITVTAHPVAESYVVHDKMSEGLTFNTGSIIVKDLKLGTHYTVAETPDDGCTFHIEFKKDYLDTIEKATDIVITYSATINENAVIVSATDDPLKNVAKLDYNDVTNDVESPVTLKTLEFDLVKTDKDNNVFTGETIATFKLYNAETGGQEIPVVKTDEGFYRLAVTGETGVAIEAGNVVIKGLDGDITYWLEEITAPAGYNILNKRKPVKFEDKTNLKATVENGKWISGGVHIVNLSGTELPSTGGMGTTLFYLGGGAMFLGALVLLVTKKRMKD